MFKYGFDNLLNVETEALNQSFTVGAKTNQSDDDRGSEKKRRTGHRPTRKICLYFVYKTI